MIKTREEVQAEAVANARANLIANAKDALASYDEALKIGNHDPVMSNPTRLAKLRGRVDAAIQKLKEFDAEHGTEVEENGDE